MIEIIPAIDIIDKKCIRLTQGDFARQRVYDQSPLEAAKMFESIGVRRLHIVDLEGAQQGRLINISCLYEIAAHTNLIVDYGGGVKTSVDIDSLLNAGAAMISIGSLAVQQPGNVLSLAERYTNKILLGADVKKEEIMINGWATHTGINIIKFINNFYKNGITHFFCTDIARDGMLQGVSCELYKKIMTTYPALKLIASGGVSSLQDIDALAAAGCSGVIIGKALYEGLITLKDLEKSLN